MHHDIFVLHESAKIEMKGKKSEQVAEKTKYHKETE